MNEAEHDAFNNQVLLLRLGVVFLTLIIIVGTVYYGIHYIRYAINRLSAPPRETTANPSVKYQLVIRARVGENHTPAIGLQVAIDEFGQPLGRNLISTTVTTNAAGTAIAELPVGQYTIRPAQPDQWSGLTTVDLTSSREVSLLINPATQ